MQSKLVIWKVPESQVKALSACLHSRLYKRKEYRLTVQTENCSLGDSEASDTEFIMAITRYPLSQCLALVFLVELVLCQNFQLILRENTPQAVTLACRNSAGVVQDIENIEFWLNRTRDDSQDLRDRGDILIFEDQTRNEISFTISRSIEGFYTCGQQLDSVNFDESAPLILVCK